MLFTVSPKHRKEYRCSACSETEQMFRYVASSYYKLNPQERPEVIFAQVQFPDSEQVFTIEKVETVPVVAFYPHSTAKGSISKAWKIKDQDEVVEHLQSAETLLQAVRKTLGVHFTLSYELNDYRYHILFFGSVIAAYIYYIRDSPIISTIEIFRSRRFYLFLSIFIFALSVSGSLYCIISGSKWYDGDLESGKYFIFATSEGRRTQTILEGFLAAGMYLTFSLLVIILVTFDPNAISIPCTKNKGSAANRLLRYILSFVIILGLIAAASFLMLTTVKNVAVKNSWADPHREFEEGFGMSADIAWRRFLIYIKRTVGAQKFDTFYQPLKGFFNQYKDVKLY